MKKMASRLLAGAVCAGILAGSGTVLYAEEGGNKQIEKLSIAFVPSREPEEIITATEPLKEMLTTELAGLGYDVAEVDITVGTRTVTAWLLFCSIRPISISSAFSQT